MIGSIQVPALSNSHKEVSMGSSPGTLGRLTSKLTGVLGKRTRSLSPVPPAPPGPPASPGQPAPPGRPEAVLRNPSFRLLFFGQSLSNLGDRALIIAFGI